MTQVVATISVNVSCRNKYLLLLKKIVKTIGVALIDRHKERKEEDRLFLKSVNGSASRYRRSTIIFKVAVASFKLRIPKEYDCIKLLKKLSSFVKEDYY